MVPTLLIGDFILVNKYSYGVRLPVLNKKVVELNAPQRGDVVVFERPPNDPKSKPDDPDVLIKRVIAIGGDTVEIKGGKVFINGAETKEGYVRSGAITTDLPLATIAEDELFVMGDNREHSLDGRIFGPIKKSSLVGRAIARIWPLDRLGTL
jgi:signal peptidase I